LTPAPQPASFISLHARPAAVCSCKPSVLARDLPTELEDEEEDVEPSLCRRVGARLLGAPCRSPSRRVGEAVADANLVLAPRTDRRHASTTMRDEYQQGPSVDSINVTGSPASRACIGVWIYAAHPLSPPFRTLAVTSSFRSFGGAPIACAMSRRVHRRTPHSSQSCIRQRISSQTPRALQEQRRRFELLRQSAG
jgi:hypothetical protein